MVDVSLNSLSYAVQGFCFYDNKVNPGIGLWRTDRGFEQRYEDDFSEYSGELNNPVRFVESVLRVPDGNEKLMLDKLLPVMYALGPFYSSKLLSELGVSEISGISPKGSVTSTDFDTVLKAYEPMAVWQAFTPGRIESINSDANGVTVKSRFGPQLRAVNSSVDNYILYASLFGYLIQLSNSKNPNLANDLRFINVLLNAENPDYMSVYNSLITYKNLLLRRRYPDDLTIKLLPLGESKQVFSALYSLFHTERANTSFEAIGELMGEIGSGSALGVIKNSSDPGRKKEYTRFYSIALSSAIDLSQDQSLALLFLDKSLLDFYDPVLMPFIPRVTNESQFKWFTAHTREVIDTLYPSLVFPIQNNLLHTRLREYESNDWLRYDNWIKGSGVDSHAIQEAISNARDAVWVYALQLTDELKKEVMTEKREQSLRIQLLGDASKKVRTMRLEDPLTMSYVIVFNKVKQAKSTVGNSEVLDLSW